MNVLATQTRRVVMADVDGAGILYYATPYRWAEEMFTGWLHELGHPVSDVLAAGQGCPAVSSCASYARALSLDMVVECTLAPDHLGTTSFGVRMRVMVADSSRPAVEVANRHVWGRMGPAGFEPGPVPDWLRERLG